MWCSPSAGVGGWKEAVSWWLPGLQGQHIETYDSCSVSAFIPPETGFIVEQRGVEGRSKRGVLILTYRSAGAQVAQQDGPGCSVETSVRGRVYCEGDISMGPGWMSRISTSREERGRAIR